MPGLLRGFERRRDVLAAAERGGPMDCRIALIHVPVTDVDRAIAFYVDRLGWTLDHDVRVDESTRFVQVTPPTSACSIAFGEGINPMAPGSQRGIQVVVDDARAVRADLVARGVEATDVDDLPWGSFTFFQDPDGNAWTVQQIPDRS
jgi:predicted enzyme related to lactoylglutathione lyase